MKLFLGLTERSWNGVDVPETAGPFMLAPNRRHPVNPGNAETVLDSGAFGDERRLSFAGALERQFAHEERNGYTAGALVAYDWLIDEVWLDGRRHKRRWREHDAEKAVAETIAANRFLALADIGDRGRVHPIQGVTAEQQARCAEAVLPMIRPGDTLGLGGWCIIGWYPPRTDARRNIEREFWRMAEQVIPMAAQHNVQRVHLFGVMVAGILGPLLWLCDQHEIELSTDSSGPQKRPSMGQWGYAEWARKCSFPPGPERGRARVRHVAEVRAWLAGLRGTHHYKPPVTAGRVVQMRLF